MYIKTIFGVYPSLYPSGLQTWGVTVSTSPLMRMLELLHDLPGWEQFGSFFLDYSVAARGTPHQADPLPGKPAGDLPFSELLGMTQAQTRTRVTTNGCAPPNVSVQPCESAHLSPLPPHRQTWRRTESSLMASLASRTPFASVSVVLWVSTLDTMPSL